jgi:hypothetical protein
MIFNRALAHRCPIDFCRKAVGYTSVEAVSAAIFKDSPFAAEEDVVKLTQAVGDTTVGDGMDLPSLKDPRGIAAHNGLGRVEALPM